MTATGHQPEVSHVVTAPVPPSASAPPSAMSRVHHGVRLLTRTSAPAAGTSQTRQR
ncbi:hypothetical protein [Dactylosporangium maewongense]|uniref:hypothetical protein n=1 Tax=Dactylosporangium maewongense TaxID=634393 RepID=UPI0031D42C1E